jgi:hypothetical protein
MFSPFGQLLMNAALRPLLQLPEEVLDLKSSPLDRDRPSEVWRDDERENAE